jgi:hypothetical protein
MLADPELRALYNELRRDPTIPVPFPYSGFGSLLLRGERAAENGVFFANRILAFMPERRLRKVPVPLRKLDYFDDFAILRDRNRKLEVLIDHQLLPIRWDPTWSQWRHLITATVEISADFIHTGRYRKRGGEWKLIEWETALPSRTELEMPEGVEEDILKARRTHTRFGEYWKHIDHLRNHVQQIPTERGELQRLCWNLGLPGDFDVAQITWRPGLRCLLSRGTHQARSDDVRFPGRIHIRSREDGSRRGTAGWARHLRVYSSGRCWGLGLAVCRDNPAGHPPQS